MKTIGYATKSATAPLEPFSFERRELRPNDVQMEVLYCGVCHSDLHMAHNDWGSSVYPIVPGHEIIGRVTAVGSDVRSFKPGDAVAVGCMVDSCMACDQCRSGEEQYCREGMTPTYSAPDRLTGDITYGGYSKHLVAREEFVMSVPDGLDLSKAAPILCAGITTYSPLKTWNVGEGSRVGVIGMGGLGHMAIKLAVAMDAQVTVISRSPKKEETAKNLGAHNFLLSTNEEAMKAAKDSFDLIIDTIPVKHDLGEYTSLLDVDGTLVLVGQIGPTGELNTVPLVYGRKRVAGSLIGGIRETQELLEFCARKNILPTCEMIKIDEINKAFESLEKGDLPYRFVIDMSSLQLPKEEN